MSKAAKLSLFILIALLLATLGFALFSVSERGVVEDLLEDTQEELSVTRSEFKSRERKYVEDTGKLNEEIKKANTEKAQLTQEIKKVERETDRQIRDLTAQADDVGKDRDKWKRRIETIRTERDKLLTKINDLTKELAEKPEPRIIYKGKEPEPKVKTARPAIAPSYDFSQAPSYSSESSKAVDEEYWANLLKEKASLEIDIQTLKDELSGKSIEVVEIRQTNEDLQMEVDTLRHDKGEIEVEIQHKSDMLDNISLELARTKNDKKFIADRVEKLKSENGELRGQLKQLVSVKNALEKSIVRLSQEKEKMSGELGRTETLIQSKIDEIWEIKDDLDRSIRSAQSGVQSSEVELPPIIVSSSGQAQHYNVGTPTGFSGKVISINEGNNFVIVDIGENAGVHLGDSLSVYRDSKYIARLEVIQVRKDISAADLKDQWSKVKVGDIIR